MFKCFACGKTVSMSHNFERHLRQHSSAERVRHYQQLQKVGNNFVHSAKPEAKKRQKDVTATGEQESDQDDGLAVDSGSEGGGQTGELEESCQVDLSSFGAESLRPGMLHGEEESVSSEDDESSEATPEPVVLRQRTRAATVAAGEEEKARLAKEAAQKQAEAPMTREDLFAYFLGKNVDQETTPLQELPGATDVETSQKPHFSVTGDFLDAIKAKPGFNVNYEMYNLYQLRLRPQRQLTTNEQHHLRLRKLCTDARVPLKFAESILQWAREASKDKFFDEPPVSEKNFTRNISKAVGLEHAGPIKTKCHYKNAGIDLEVVVFDAVEAVISLLSDADLMRKENLNYLPHSEGKQMIFTDETFDPAPRMDGSHLADNYVFEDMYTGCLAQVAHHNKVTLPGREACVQVNLFIDKTHIDRHGRLCQEPVCMTLGLFNHETRAKPIAHRVIGLIPNSSVHISASSSHGKLCDYHSVVKHVLDESGLTALMNGGGIYWKFPSSVTEGNMEGVLHFYFGFLAGDTAGHDTACGHYQSRTALSPMLCRKCNTPFDQTDNPEYVYTYLTKLSVTNGNLYETKDGKTKKPICNKLGYHHIPDGNAFSKLDFGVDDEYSHVAHRTPYDLDHTIRKGNMLYTVEAFRRLQRRKQVGGGGQTRKPHKIIQEQIAELDADEEASDVEIDRDAEEDLETIAVASKKSSKKKKATKKKDPTKNVSSIFSKKPKKVAEKAMLIQGALLTHQSDRSLPRTYFPQGAMSTDKLNCHEYVGLLLLYALFVNSTIGEQFLASKDKKNDFLTFTKRGWLGNKQMNQW